MEEVVPREVKPVWVAHSCATGLVWRRRGHSRSDSHVGRTLLSDSLCAGRTFSVRPTVADKSVRPTRLCGGYFPSCSFDEANCAAWLVGFSFLIWS